MAHVGQQLCFVYIFWVGSCHHCCQSLGLSTHNLCVVYFVTRFPGVGSVFTHCCFGCLLFFPFLLEGLLILGLSDWGTAGVPDFLLFTHIAGLTVGVVGLFVLRSSRISTSLSGVTTEIYSPYLLCPRYSSIS